MTGTLNNKKLLIVADAVDNTVSPGTVELLPMARRLGLTLEETLVIVPVQNAGKSAEELCTAGCDVLVLDHEEFQYHNPSLLAKNITSLTREFNSEYFACAHTLHGAVTAAQAATELKWPVITSVEDVQTKDSACTITRSLMNGKVLMKLTPDSPRLALTVQPGAFSKEKIKAASPGRFITRMALNADTGYTPQGLSAAAASQVKLKEADVIVAAGRGLGAKENLELIRATASLFKNSAVGASRSLCDNGWLPYAHQVGMTGTVVSPRLYLACGISGAQQHLVGMKDAQLIAAVNTDPKAHIFSVAHYGIVDDLKEFLPVFIERVRARMG